MPTVTVVSGLVAVIDVLGTKLLSVDEANRFLAFRDSITKYDLAAFEKHGSYLQLQRVQSFTIGDTMVYAYEPQNGTSLADVERFCHFLRITVSHSIESGFPVRGAFAIGEFYREGQTTVIGPAVADAASWYEAADWIGVQATPHASLSIQALAERSTRQIDHVLYDWPVPMKNGPHPILRAVNWPKAYYVAGLKPERAGNARSQLLSALTRKPIPKGTEQKYTNALRFFDAIVAAQSLEQEFAQPSPAPPEDDEPGSL